MNSDNEKTLMQSLRVSGISAEDLLAGDRFAGFASEDEILAAWQEGTLTTEQETALKAALASSNSLRQQWLALSAAVPHQNHGAVWHGLFRWHWATIGMTASVALVGVLLFRQGQLPLTPSQPVVMHERGVPEVAEAEALADPARAAKPQAKVANEALQKRQLAEHDTAGFQAETLSDSQDSVVEERADMTGEPMMEDRAMASDRPQLAPAAPSPSLPSAARLAPEPAAPAPDWARYLEVYHGQPAADAGDEMARLAQAVLAVEAGGCGAADVADLQQAFQAVSAHFPDIFLPLKPEKEAQWCELGEVLSETAEQATR